jgi:hypothetical protein
MSVFLPEDFHGERYGLSYRLVYDGDADFILSLRTDTWHTRFIHSTDNSMEKQLEWMRKYKQREFEGRDYYFIYFKDNEPVGVNRVYNIFEYYGTEGSWICKPKSEPNIALATYMILHDIMFEDLQLDLSIFDVRKENKKVQRMHKIFGAEIIGESDIDVYFSIFKNSYFEKRKQMVNYF